MPTNTFKSLDNKYGYFVDPKAIVKINGEDIMKSPYLAVTNVSVVLTSGYESNICKVDISEKITKSTQTKIDFNSDMSKIKVGDKIEVELGYQKDTTSVFSGYIMALSTSIEEHLYVSYHLESMDAKVFMMANLHSRQNSDANSDTTKYTKAVAAILKDYSKFDLGSANIVDSEDINVPIEQHNKSDYEFIVSIAKKLNYLFFISYENGKATPNFVPYKNCKDCILTVNPDNHVYDANIETTLVGQISGVTVRGNNVEDPTQEIEATVTLSDIETIGNGKDKSSDISRKIVHSETKKTIIDHSVTSADVAKARAIAELTKASMGFVTGEVSVKGVPELKPGKYLELKGFSEQLDNQYFITQVEHRVSSGRYITNCKLGANSI